MNDHQDLHIDAEHPGEMQPDEAAGSGAGGAAENQAEASVENDIAQRLEAAERRAQESLEKLLRTQADLENLRKRTDRELVQARKYAVEKFATELLAVKDSLELGLQDDSNPVDAEKLHEGVELTLKMFDQVFGKFGIEVVNPEAETFDPDWHQAMLTQPGEEHPPNTVLHVMQKGYTLNGRLLRPALVIVAGPVAPNDGEAGAETPSEGGGKCPPGA